MKRLPIVGLTLILTTGILFYLVFSGLLTILLGYLEKKLDYFRG